ncbi:putative RNA methyltransferase [Cocos nucifera]|uniref:Putative RNA methyltransferase n=1 Tax=Cocos nucifera TaxID=13894 RepID=A0A8K0HXT0_COCNU|nr:putative RNA methyltransferase [Cocos nucifera]
MAVAAFPSCGARRLKARPWLHAVRSSASSPSPPRSPADIDGLGTAPTSTTAASRSFFPKRGQTLELVCESLAFKGKGVCKVVDTGFVLMCDRALPGERFLGRVSRKKGNHAEVTKLKTITPHWDLVEAPCEYASACGGCKTQNLAYEAQLRAKEQQVRDLIVRVGRFPGGDPEFASVLKPIVPCDLKFHYRNKMEFSFGAWRWIPIDSLSDDQDQIESGYALGLHAPGFFDKVLHIEKCLLQSEAANKVSIMNNVNSSVGNTSVGEEEYTLHGKPTITEMLRGLTFQISANSFFQTNSHQAEVLYKLIEDCAGLRGDGSEIVLDLFCGTGTIGLTLAKRYFDAGTLLIISRVRHVYGYEVVAEAISDAQRNAELNDIHNATFIQGDLNKINEKFGSDLPKADIVILDPNRPGLHMKLIKYLLKLQAARVVYVSCNPATCARDLDYLCHGVADKVENSNLIIGFALF